MVASSKSGMGNEGLHTLGQTVQRPPKPGRNNVQWSQQSQKLSAMLKKIDVAINKDEGGIIPTKRSPEAIAASYRSAAEIKQTPEIKKRVPAPDLEDNINQNVHEFRKNANRK